MYEVEDHGLVIWFLGVRVIRDRANRTITLAHDAYINKIASKFKIKDRKLFPNTPLPSEELKKSGGAALK